MKLKGDATGPSGTRDKAPVRATPRLLPPAVRLVDQLGLVPPVLLRAPIPQAPQETPCAAELASRPSRRIR